ncbi:uncharacterized protein LOC105688609 isoform X1 [Athalia rosae]|uniref:uncharacterized protein LOC105688609 isoform X1 n=1 Tax=Athalia rosae TaxID=37344 RepID=UPI0020334CBA|nr:uncharacterized protein LOC105688609 isoform X1 [Athalia rosae]
MAAAAEATSSSGATSMVTRTFFAKRKKKLARRERHILGSSVLDSTAVRLRRQERRHQERHQNKQGRFLRATMERERTFARLFDYVTKSFAEGCIANAFNAAPEKFMPIARCKRIKTSTSLSKDPLLSILFR